MSSTDPQVMFRYSDDGGHTWSAEQWVSLGVEGNYAKRVELFQQGSAIERVYEIVTTDPRSFSILDAYANIEIGDD